MSKIAPKLFYVAALALIGFSIFGSRGLIHLRSLNREVSGLERKSTQLEQELQGVKLELESIRNDPVALEQRVRSELGLSRANEIVYVEKSKSE